MSVVIGRQCDSSRPATSLSADIGLDTTLGSLACTQDSEHVHWTEFNSFSGGGTRPWLQGLNVATKTPHKGGNTIKGMEELKGEGREERRSLLLPPNLRWRCLIYPSSGWNILQCAYCIFPKLLQLSFPLHVRFCNVTLTSCPSRSGVYLSLLFLNPGFP